MGAEDGVAGSFGPPRHQAPKSHLFVSGLAVSLALGALAEVARTSWNGKQRPKGRANRCCSPILMGMGAYSVRQCNLSISPSAIPPFPELVSWNSGNDKINTM